MKKALIASLLALIAFSAMALPKVAVLNPTLAKGIDEEVGAFIVDKILSQLIASRTFNILDRASRDVIWQERNFQLTSGEIESKQIKEIGKGLGADFIVVVKVIHIGTLYAMSAQMINVESLEVVSVASAEAPDKLENLVSLASECGAQLAGGGRATAASVGAAAPSTGAAASTPMPKTEAVTGGDLFDFAARTYKIPLGGEWAGHDDSGNGGDSYAALDPNALKNDGVIRFDYKLNPKYEYRLALAVAGFDAPKDLSKYSGIEVKWRGSGHQARIEVLSDSVKDYCWHSFLVNKTSKDWTVTKVPFKKFYQPDWGKQIPMDLKKIIGIQFITASQRIGEKGWIEIAYLKLVE
jgi:hypothetical protein